MPFRGTLVSRVCTFSQCLLCSFPVMGWQRHRELSPEEKKLVRRHEGRGLCTHCHKKQKRRGKLENFPRVNALPGTGKNKSGKKVAHDRE